jgi:hypothetical protein
MTELPGRAGVLAGLLMVAHLVPIRPSGAPADSAAAARAKLEAMEAQVAGLERTVDSLGNRISRLEQRASNPLVSSAAVAPFTVVDKAGKPIFTVFEGPGPGRGFKLTTKSGKDVVYGSALEDGGFLKALDARGALQAVAGVHGNFAGFVLRESANVARATLALTNGKPSIELSNDDSKVVATMGQGSTGGGVIQLGDAAGNAMVEAGVTTSGVGLVRTLPIGTPGAGLVGMPGTFLIGRHAAP